MIKNFDISAGVVHGTVVRVINSDFFFIQNGDPKQIFCHCLQGGSLVVSPEGRFVLNQNEQIFPPSINEQIILVRESYNANDRNYTKAARWALAIEWQEVKWAVNAHYTFRAVAYDHRQNGHFTSNTKSDVVLVAGTLLKIRKQYPRGLDDGTLNSNYSVQLAGVTLSYRVRWERLDSDSVWTECGDPR